MSYDEAENMRTPRMTLPICLRRVRHEQTTDHTLPDYYPEIRRLLYVGATVLPPAKYVGGSRIELDGGVDYRMLYVGADGELYCAPFSGEYSVAVPPDADVDVELGEGVSVLAVAEAESLSPRVTGPRKLSLRTRMQSEISAFGRRGVEERMRGEYDADALCIQNGEVTLSEPVTAVGEELVLTESIDGIGAEGRVISADAGILWHEASAKGSEIAVSGEVRLCLLCQRPDGRTEELRRRIPFEGMVETDTELRDGTAVRARGTVSQLTVKVEEGVATCELHVLPEVQAFVKRSFAYRADLFATDRQAQTAYADYALPVLLRTLNGNLTQSERISAADAGVAQGATVVATFGNATFSDCEWEDGKCVLTGQSRYTLVCERDGEYFSTELTLPLRYETEGKMAKSDHFSASAAVVECRARLSGDSLELDAELSVDGAWLCETRIRTVEEVAFSEPTPRRGGEMILCYPASGETRWSIAKRYRTRPERIVGDPETDPYVVI